MSHQDEVCPRPYGRHTPADVGFPLAAQRGIHKPSFSRYAISISSSSNDVYSADKLFPLEDNTWQLIYCAHRKNAGKTMGSTEYNLSLLRCLRRGLPVGVFFKEKPSYRCLGLAFVESFDTSTDLFLLRGPITSSHDNETFSPIPPNERKTVEEAYLKDHQAHFSESDVSELLEDLDDVDRRKRVNAEIVRRAYQARFRSQLIDAYDGKCAISGFDAIPALQAAHISSYLGPQSQLTSNGLLLRADLHILFDASMISVNPDTFRIQLAQPLLHTHYVCYQDHALSLPHDKTLWPSEQRLAAHFETFRQTQQLRTQKKP